MSLSVCSQSIRSESAHSEPAHSEPGAIAPPSTRHIATFSWIKSPVDTRVANASADQSASRSNKRPRPKQTEQDIVVISSIRQTPDTFEQGSDDAQLSFWLMRLQSPGTRLIYLSAQPIEPSRIDDCLKHLPATLIPFPQDRLTLLSTDDASSRSLAEQILKRPCLIHRIKQSLRPNCAVMACDHSTRLERELAMTLGIPLIADNLDLLY
ncbi:MAG: hypothetical protein AAGF01_22515 [Cyanobacteria bacterium P01_G01_bin.38]